MSVSVYVIREEQSERPVKIGFAASAQRRVSSLQGGNFRRMRLVATRQFPDNATARFVEASLHEQFQAARLVGEWFDVDAHEVSAALENVLSAHNYSHDSYAVRIVDEIFGGARQMATDLTVPERHKRYPWTTVQSWKDAGTIPSRHHQWVLERGRELGKEISHADFFEPAKKSAPPVQKRPQQRDGAKA